MMAIEDLSESQNYALVVGITVSSVLSMLGASVVLYSFARNCYQKRRIIFSNLLVYVLCSIDLALSIVYLVGRAGPESIDTPLSWVCTLQAAATQWLALGSLVWTACIATNMYLWVCWRETEESTRRYLPYYAGITFSICTIMTITPAIAAVYGDSVLWCWISEPSWQLHHFYSVVFIAFFFVLVVSERVKKEIRHRCERTEASALTLFASERAVVRKLQQYLLAFLGIWVFALLDRVIWSIRGRPYFPASVVHAVSQPLQGFLNAIVYSNADKIIQYWWRSRWLKTPTLKHTRSEMFDVQPEFFEEENKKLEEKSFYVTSFNMGETGVPPNVDEWLPLDHDVYIIGVQECLCFNELRAVMHQHLGGPECYVEFSDQIGSNATQLGFHGYIGLTVYAKKQYVDTGVFSAGQFDLKEARVNRGINLLLRRAPNKGAVGMAFRFYDSTFAFLTAHLSSDQKGKNMAEQRNEDVYSIIKDMVLEEQDYGFDFPLVHQHTIFLGDLNYRLLETPENVLDKVSVVMRLESKLRQEREAIKAKEEAQRARAPLVSKLKAGESQTGSARALKLQNAADTCWKELRELDELYQVMQRSKIFCNFFEPPIAFPPSYRRQKGAAATEELFISERIAELYSTRGSNDKGRLSAKSYTICESLVMSDHRPVCSEVKVQVDTLFRTLPPRGDPTANSLLIFEVELSNIMATLVDQDLSKISSVVTLFPLPPEDPYMGQRKIHEVAGILSIPSARQDSVLFPNITQTSWSQVQSTGSLTFKGQTQIHHGVHVLLQFLDAENKSLGEGVIALRKASREPGKAQNFSSKLTKGSQLKGKVQGKVMVAAKSFKQCLGPDGGQLSSMTPTDASTIEFDRLDDYSTDGVYAVHEDDPKLLQLV